MFNHCMFYHIFHQSRCPTVYFIFSAYSTIRCILSFIYCTCTYPMNWGGRSMMNVQPLHTISRTQARFSFSAAFSFDTASPLLCLSNSSSFTTAAPCRMVFERLVNLLTCPYLLTSRVFIALK